MREATVKLLQELVHKTFYDVFGRTPLNQRIDDIFNEAIELKRYTDIKNLKEETGDLLASALQLCNENEWDAQELVGETLCKIKRRKLQYKALGRKTKVGIIGGAFNPITDGHIKLAQFVLNTSRIVEEIWLTPCYGHMYGKVMATPQQRLDMCHLAAKVDARIRVFHYEIDNKLKGETYHFLKQLLEDPQYKDQYDFSYVIGLDNANTFDKWVNYEDLERMMRFIVVGRQGIPRDEKVDWYLKQPHIYLKPDKNDIPECSSTQVRNALFSLNTDEVQKLVDPEVYKYILANVPSYMCVNPH